MSHQHHNTSPRVHVTSASMAEELLSSAMSTTQALGLILETETSLMRVGQVGQALALSEQKAATTRLYAITMENVKANLLALKRFAEPSIAKFKEHTEKFQAILQRNNTVLITTKAISESLMRTLAQETQALQQPTGYGTTQRQHTTNTTLSGFYLQKNA
jgi:hypothetical protein